MRPQLTERAMRELEEAMALRGEAVSLLEAVAAEWRSDPTSVACFDLRIVERAQYVVARLKKLEPW
jgi:hypothetical protein